MKRKLFNLPVLLLVSFTAGSMCSYHRQKQLDREKSLSNPQLEQKQMVTWSKWSEPKVSSDSWDGTRLWQTRTNLATGECEMRCHPVSAGGGYK